MNKNPTSTTTVSTQYRDLNEFLAKHSAKNQSTNNNNEHTIVSHTRIPGPEQNIFAGSYIIPPSELPVFYNLYVSHIFEQKKKEYLTEKQLETGGPMVVDMDFRYEHSVNERQHTRNHVIDIIGSYLEVLKDHFVFEEFKPFSVYGFEKPKVNRLQDGSLTKDGIHLYFGLQADHIIQCMIRAKMLEQLNLIMEELPLINTLESILDEGISKGHTNWQLFGSRKPGNEAYELTHHYVITYVKENDCFDINEKDVKLFNMKHDFCKLSVQYTENPRFEIHPKVMDVYQKQVEHKKTRVKTSSSKNKITRISDEKPNQDEEEDSISLSCIENKETLQLALDQVFRRLTVKEQEIREVHEYAQALPPKYYEPGSHLLNRCVAFALKHCDDRLFLSWVMVRSKASDFNYAEIPGLYEIWKKLPRTNKEGRSLNQGSIRLWVKNENPEEYNRIKKNSRSYYINEAIKTNTEYDYAQLLKHEYGENYVCVSYDKRNGWYHFKNHHWVIDKKISLREKISTEIYDLFGETSDAYEAEAAEYTEEDDRKKYLVNMVKVIQTIRLNLKKTAFKDHIIREASEKMFDDQFIRNADANPYLLGFNNGVVDFANKVFRPGYPEDYITKSTNIDYVPCDDTDFTWCKYRDEIHVFMKTLFPIDELLTYMWDHLASCLIGTNKNQTFHIYHGSGSNGKTLLVDLMSAAMGEYKGTVPITLVTDARGKIGGTSDEVLKLKAVRYAVMQEPQKSVKLNEGVMKELSGGDPIQARGLYCESEVFTPQFKLAVGTNSLFDIESNDDGTWRRIRKITFPSKFVDDGEYYEDDSCHVFKKDKSLNEKLRVFAPIFMGMLVKRAFETQGIVVDCEYVMEASRKYRNGQDHISAFLKEKVRRVLPGTTGTPLKKTSLMLEFKQWCEQEYGKLDKKIKSEEMYEAVNKKFKVVMKKNQWPGLEIIREEEEEEEIIVIQK